MPQTQFNTKTFFAAPDGPLCWQGLKLPIENNFETRWQSKEHQNRMHTHWQRWWWRWWRLVRMRQGGSTVAWPSLPPDPEHGYDGNQAREHRSRPHQPYRTRSLPSSHHPTPRIATGSGHNSALQCTRSYSTSTLHHHIRPYFTHHMRTTHQRKTTQRVPYCPVTRLVEEE